MKKLLNFGSLNIDYTYSVEEFVTAGKTVRALDMNKSIGGKGLNQSVAFARAGGSVYHAGKIGADGVALKNYLRENNVNTEFVEVCEFPSGHAVIQLDADGGNCIMVYGGANDTVTASFADRVLEHFDGGDMLLVQNEISNIGYIIQRAHEKGMYVVLNPSPAENLGVPHEAVDCYILNEHEAKIIFSADSLEDAVEKMRSDCRGTCYVLTLGAEGSMYIGADGFAKVNAVPADVKDTTAAGDTFTGYYLYAVARGLSQEEALKLASRAASAAVSRYGAACSVPWRDEL